MGIYPSESVETKDDTLILRRSLPGVEYVTVYEAIVKIENRTDCFCCSCTDERTDAACRNHGFYGKRPCEEHGMPGYVWQDSDTMPATVQEARKGDYR